jgi:hypothetical protein
MHVMRWNWYLVGAVCTDMALCMCADVQERKDEACHGEKEGESRPAGDVDVREGGLPGSFPVVSW